MLIGGEKDLKDERAHNHVKSNQDYHPNLFVIKCKNAHFKWTQTYMDNQLTKLGGAIAALTWLLGRCWEMLSHLKKRSPV